MTASEPLSQPVSQQDRQAVDDDDGPPPLVEEFGFYECAANIGFDDIEDFIDTGAPDYAQAA